ncbi:GFA family protein [Aquibium microcysteis]|uniref:GFA family protein n=1 Tax=Aquibium microcysteis TaxID=675281 RepID=UPI00165CFACA|nr:GFA family protein [Aquibium microcysteis]
MSAISLPLDGTCRCGGVRMRVKGAPLFTCACHCTGCQKMSASAYSLSALFSADDFEVVEGEPVLGGMRGALQHFFCPACMSWMFTRPPGLEGLVNVRPTLFQDLSWFAVFAETYTIEKLPFAETGAVRSYDRFPDAGAFRELVDSYARWRT